jgi:multiple sugar transport system substrate-binding protein
MEGSPFSNARRLATLVAVATLFVGTLTGCGGQEGSDSHTLTVMSSFTKGDATGIEFARTVKQFTKQTGIKVDVENVNYADLPKAYEAAKLGGKERDIIIENLTPDTSDWLPQGLVVDVKKYLNDWGIADKVEPKAVTYWTQGDSGVAGFPFIGFNWPVWYNTDLLKKAGVTEIPRTTGELTAAVKKLRAAHIQPMSLGGGEWPVQNFTTWMVQQYIGPEEAGKLFSDGGFCQSKGAVKGLDLFGKLRDAGVFIDDVQGYNTDEMTAAYYNGKAAMMPSGSWAYTTTPAKIAKVTELAGFPATPGGAYAKPTAFNGHSAGFFLSPNGEKKIDAVEKFMKFVYTKENLQNWASDASQILAAKSEAVGAVKSSNPLVTKGSEVNKDVVDFLLLPDNYIPAGFDYQPVATEFIGHKGEKGAEFCKALDKLYTDK